MRIDLHVHTVHGSSDSSLTPEALCQEAQRVGLQGVCLTEHGGGWDDRELEKLARRYDLLLIKALEVDTDAGHVLALGLGTYSDGMHRLAALRRAIDKVGGFLIAAHPFRNMYNQPPYNRLLMNRSGGGSDPSSAAEAARHPLFGLVDEIEVANGANSDAENRFALAVARHLGMRGTGGSDAHSTHGLGRCATVFEDSVRSRQELLAALRAGDFYPEQGFPAVRAPSTSESR